MANPEGDPVWPGRSGAVRTMVIDEGHYIAGKGVHFPGGAHYADDYMTLFLQGSTQYDALGHVWYDDQIWNGYDAKTTIGGLAKASVLPIAEKGVVGRGILLDIARWPRQGRPRRRRDVHPRGPHGVRQGAGHRDPEARHPRSSAPAGSPSSTRSPARSSTATSSSPGLTYSPELVQWFHDMEIPNLVTDTIANEVTDDPVSGVRCRCTTR